MAENHLDSLNIALLELQILAHQAVSMGNNDSESGAIQSLIDQVQSGKITPDLALERARAIIESKNI